MQACQNFCYKLEYQTKNYEWGKKGHSSLVAALKKGSCQNFEIEQDQTYAELWMGSHVSGPSLVIDGDQKIDMASFLVQHNLPDIPYLFKALSIENILSIQVHPDKQNAIRLNKQFPDIYRDPNHKPEIAIAITRLDALCGFRPISQIAHYLSTISEFELILDNDLIGQIKGFSGSDEGIINKQIVLKMLELSKETVKDLISSRCATIKKLFDNGTSQSNFEDITFLNVASTYPDDIGCFFIYILNVVHLKSGEAVLLSANTPHAYISGDIMECMACSDNVIRLGLTPKFVDKKTAIDILSYQPKTDFKVEPITVMNREGLTVERYLPSVEEFKILHIGNDKPCSLTQTDIEVAKMSIMIAVNGSMELTLSKDSRPDSDIASPTSVKNDTLTVRLQKGDAFLFTEPCRIIEYKSSDSTADIWIAY